MKEITKLKMHFGQVMADILEKLESNTIYFKILPGIKATTLEIETDRNSILLQPNRPVIEGKRKAKYLKRKIYGVYEGVTIDQVVEYMSNDKIDFKKIMVTPESFRKVLQAAEILGINIYKEYFLLFDECDKTIKDVNFRKTIIKPMNDFFKFEKKAFISATAMFPSDPRFLEFGFKQVIIEPTFDYCKDVEVFITNNVSILLKEKITELANETLCIFLNSLQAITLVIEDLKIKDSCHIYCSKEKMYMLKSHGYNAFDNIPTDHRSGFAKINFITSRFNAAVDIMLNYKPTVILATNLHLARHSMIDPTSEAVQIVGRFRNGVSRIIAVSNIDEHLHTRTPNESLSFLDGCEDSYNTIKMLHTSAKDDGAKETLGEALELVTFSAFLNEDGTKNHFMYDNFLYEESVKCIFQSAENFQNAYISKYFNPSFETKDYVISDENYLVPSGGVSMKTLASLVVNTINLVTKSTNIYQIDNRAFVMKELEKSFPLLYKAYFILGEQELLKKSYSKNRIKEAIRLKIELEDKRNFGFIYDLSEAFEDGYRGTTVQIKGILKRLIEKHKLTIRPEIKLLQEYFKISNRTTIKQPDIKGYVIQNARFNRKKDTKLS
ncbi:MAG: hypothetical protein EOO90_17060 [Pedobacter sp.]|nr:MAG: hypothetical protein EOO90_17060 [Pedobacter sp.]